MSDSFITQQIGTDVEVKGYRVLLKALEIPEQSSGGIIFAEMTKQAKARAYNIGLVLKLGDQAFQPPEKFGGKAFCKPGDWVFYSAYEREEAYINDHLCYFLNDERIYAVIPDISAVVKELKT